MPATTPYRKKSYHSMVAPTRAEITTLRIAFRSLALVFMGLSPMIGCRSVVVAAASAGARGRGEAGQENPAASVVSPIRCRRLRAAIGAQRKAQRAANTERIGKRCNAAIR